MAEEKKQRETRRTSFYQRDFLGMLETLKFRIRFKLECLGRGQPQAETKEQLTWALQVCDQVKGFYVKKLPWPAGSLTWVMGTTWPPESDLRDEFIRLEKTYTTAMKGLKS